VIEFLLKIR